MNPINMTVRCMAWEERGLWVAACIDLTLAVQADTLPAARRQLHEQIAQYVNEAVSVDAAHADALLARRAPLLDRLRYAFWRMVSQRPRLRRTVKRLIDRAGLVIHHHLAYSEPLPLRLA